MLGLSGRDIGLYAGLRELCPAAVDDPGAGRIHALDTREVEGDVPGSRPARHQAAGTFLEATRCADRPKAREPQPQSGGGRFGGEIWIGGHGFGLPRGSRAVECPRDPTRHLPGGSERTAGKLFR